MSTTEKKSPFAPRLDSILCWMQKHPRLTTDKYPGSHRISLSHALVCSSLTQRYQEVLLTKRHLGVLRILKTSKSIQADLELKKLLSQVPELTSFSLSLGDPGIALLRMKESNVEESNEYLLFDSIAEIEGLFLTVTAYSFYSKRKRRLQAEFAVIEQQMKDLVTKYRLPGRYSFNAFVDHLSKQKGERPSIEFMSDYAPTAMHKINSPNSEPDASAEDCSGKTAAEVEELINPSDEEEIDLDEQEVL